MYIICLYIFISRSDHKPEKKGFQSPDITVVFKVKGTKSKRKRYCLALNAEIHNEDRTPVNTDALSTSTTILRK